MMSIRESIERRWDYPKVLRGHGGFLWLLFSIVLCHLADCVYWLSDGGELQQMRRLGKFRERW